MKKNISLAALVILLTTVCYTLLLYRAETMDREIVFKRIQAAYNDGQLLVSPIPFYTEGVSSRNNLSGLDQMVESFYALMFMYKDSQRPLLNALNPGYYKTGDEDTPTTLMAQMCASSTPEERADASLWRVDYKPRFWHGVKALLLPALQQLDLTQINWLILISTFFLFGLLSAQVMFINKTVGVAYIAFTVSACYCSSLLFFGGIAYSVPLVSTALWGALWLGCRMLPWPLSRCIELLLVTFGGTWFCFFYQLGGEEIYAISLIAFIEVFASKEKMSMQHIRKVFQSWFYFLFGFFGSILLKHVLLVAVSGSFDPFFELIYKIVYRTSATNDAGTKIGIFTIVKSQFEWYGVTSYGIDAIYKFVQASVNLSFVLCVFTAIWIAVLKFRNENAKASELSAAFAGFLLILIVAPLRYMVLRNHSDIHVFFVNRYLFVFAGTVYFFSVWLALRARYFLSHTT